MASHESARENVIRPPRSAPLMADGCASARPEGVPTSESKEVSEERAPDDLDRALAALESAEEEVVVAALTTLGEIVFNDAVHKAEALRRNAIARVVEAMWRNQAWVQPAEADASRTDTLASESSRVGPTAHSALQRRGCRALRSLAFRTSRDALDALFERGAPLVLIGALRAALEAPWSGREAVETVEAAVVALSLFASKHGPWSQMHRIQGGRRGRR